MVKLFRKKWIPCLLKILIGGQFILILQKILAARGMKQFEIVDTNILIQIQIQ